MRIVEAILVLEKVVADAISTSSRAVDELVFVLLNVELLFYFCMLDDVLLKMMNIVVMKLKLLLILQVVDVDVQADEVEEGLYDVK